MVDCLVPSVILLRKAKTSSVVIAIISIFPIWLIKLIQQAFIVPQCAFTINSRLVVKKNAMASDNFMTYLPVLVVLGLPRPQIYAKVMNTLSNVQ